MGALKRTMDRCLLTLLTDCLPVIDVIPDGVPAPTKIYQLSTGSRIRTQASLIINIRETEGFVNGYLQTETRQKKEQLSLYFLWLVFLGYLLLLWRTAAAGSRSRTA